VIPVGCTVACYQAAKGLRSTHWSTLVEPEARKESWWKVMGIGLLSMVLLVVAVFVVVFLITGAN
jgi:hypothetical protein